MARHRHNHIVTRSYLDLFAGDGSIDCHFVREGCTKRLGTNDVAVRKNFYVAELADGTRSTAFEEAMGPIETHAVPIMRQIDDRWPLDTGDRAALTQYLALQAVRSPAWRAFFEATRLASIEERSRDDPDTDWEAIAAHSATDQYRLELMLSQVSKMGTEIGSMHWSLVRFKAPRLVTSDHPVVPVPIPTTGGDGPSAIPRRGFMNIVEFDFPLSPSHALILSWLDLPDGEPPIAGALHHAKIFNSAVRGQAERHWFSLPGTKARFGAGRWIPISYQILPQYGLDGALRSERRQRVDKVLERMIESESDGRKMTFVGPEYRISPAE